MGPIPLERGAKSRAPDTGRGEVGDTRKSAKNECRGMSYDEGQSRFATHSPDGKPIERGPQQCEAAEYDLAPRPEGRQLLEIETAVDAMRTAYFGTGGIYASRINAVEGLESGLQPVDAGTDLLMDLVIAAIGAASGGIVGFIGSRLVSVAGMVSTPSPATAIGVTQEAPPAGLAIGFKLAELAKASVTGAAASGAKNAATAALSTPGDKPSIHAFINAQVDLLEANSRDKNAEFESAQLRAELSQRPNGHLIAKKMLQELQALAPVAKMHQTIASVSEWSKAYRGQTSGRVNLEVTSDPVGRLTLGSTKIVGAKPDILKVLKDRGASVRDLMNESSQFDLSVTIDGGAASFQVPRGSRGAAVVVADHISPSWLRNFGREHLGMGPNGDPSLIASILVERDLAPQRL